MVRQPLNRTLVLSGAAALLVACQSADTAPPPVDSGTPSPPPPPASDRLVSWRLQPAGAAGGTGGALLGTYDRARQTPCRFVEADDGAVRCLPWSPHVERLTGFFADARCERALFEWVPNRANPAETAPPLVTIESQDGCRRPHSVHEAHVLDDSRPIFAGSSSGSCAEYPRQRLRMDRIEEGRLLAAGDRLSPALFAAGRRVRLPAPPGRRLGIERIESAAGGPFPVGLHDQQWNRSCHFEADLRGNRLSCWPPAATNSFGRGYLFTPTCAAPLAHVDANQGCEEPALVRGYIGGQSGLHALGPRWSGTPFFSYRNDGTGCALESFTAFSTIRVFEIGEPLAAGAIAALPLQAEGTGPVRAQVPRDEGGAPVGLPLGRVFTIFGGVLSYEGLMPFVGADGRPCTAFRVSDGTIRCLPVADLMPLTTSTFADARCTQRLVACDLCDSCETCEGKRVADVTYGSDPFGAVVALYEIGPVFTGQVYLRSSTNRFACEPYPTDAGRAFRKPAALIPWDAFPRLEERRGDDLAIPPP